MLVLFSIAMACFFALFGMLVILLRQAKSEGALERKRNQGARTIQRAGTASHTSDTHAPFGVSQTGIDLNLSNLVPAKRPDWRFMVREASRSVRGRQQQPAETSGRKPPRPFHYGVSRPDRAYSNKDLGDLTDPQSSNIARRA